MSAKRVVEKPDNDKNVPAQDLQGKRVLLVEDESSIAKPLVSMLELEGMEPHWVKSGTKAVEKVKKQDLDFDIILLDRMIPGLSGTEVFKHVRESSSIPVIFLTALDSEFDRVSGIDLGADDYITKPYSYKELLARMRSIFRRQNFQPPVGISQEHTEPEIVFEAGQIEIYPQKNQILIEKIRIEFPPKEFALLEFLVRNKNNVIARKRLIEKVWGEDFSGPTKTLDVHIKRLRDKIKPHKKKDISVIAQIDTVRSVGYRLIEK